MVHVSCDECEVMLDGSGCDNAVHNCQRNPVTLGGCRHVAPPFRDGIRDRENPPGIPGAQRAIEPTLQRIPPLAARKRVDALADFTDSHHAQEQIFSAGIPKKSDYSLIWPLAGELGWDVGVNQVCGHSSMSRPGSLSLSKSRSR